MSYFFKKGGKTRPGTPPKSNKIVYRPESTIQYVKEPDSWKLQKQLQHEADIKKFHYMKYLNRVKSVISTSAPIIAYSDPTLATAYGLYKFGPYGFHIFKKFVEEYRRTRKFEDAALTVAQNEFEAQVVSKIKPLLIKNGSEFLGKGIWQNYKEKFVKEPIPEKYDKFAENALIETIEELGKQVI